MEKILKQKSLTYNFFIISQFIVTLLFLIIVDSLMAAIFVRVSSSFKYTEYKRQQLHIYNIHLIRLLLGLISVLTKLYRKEP